MSKTIESLRRFPSKEETLFQDHVVDTYFYKKSRRKIFRLSVPKIVSKNIRYALPSLLALCLIAAAVTFIRDHYDEMMSARLAHAKEIVLYKNGLGRDAVVSAVFTGTGQGSSATRLGSVLLETPRKYGWADMTLNLRYPLNITHRRIIFFAKGKRGGERLRVAVRDSSSRSSRLDDIFLTGQWRSIALPFDRLRHDVDLSKITAIRFEYGYAGEGSAELESLPIDVSVSLHSIQLVKRGNAL